MAGAVAATAGRSRSIGILRESISKWERRAPLAPAQVSELVRQGITVLVQPSTRRIYTDYEYAHAGAVITEDVSSANTIMSVKLFPPQQLVPDRTHVLFAHVIKAQPDNMPFLDACLAKRVRLVDYEGIRDTPERGGKRLVAFGKFAGLAGMVDCLRGLGERLLTLGFSTPFLNIAQAFMYPSVEAAKKAVEDVGKEIARVGLPKEVCPLVFVFTGTGNVASGTEEIFSLLPHEWVSGSDLPAVVVSGQDSRRNRLIGVRVGLEDLVAPENSSEPASWEHYLKNPHMYQPVFHERIAPYMSVLVNGMYWDKRYPRLLTIPQLKQLKSKLPAGFLKVADVSCDVHGSVEFLTRVSSIDHPFYVYDPARKQDVEELDSPGVMMLGIDNLPSEFPREATNHFSSLLAPFVPALAVPAGTVQLPPEINSAVIAQDGALAPSYAYIAKLRATSKLAEAKEEVGLLKHRQTFLMRGHLFDSGLINKALDICEFNRVEFHVLHWNVGQDRDSESEAVVQMFSDSHEQLDQAVLQVQNLTKVMVTANAAMQRLPTVASKRYEQAHAAALRSQSAPDKPRPAHTRVGSASAGGAKRVLLLGAGRVAGPLLEYLCRSGEAEVTVASAIMAEAKQLVQTAGGAHGRAIHLDAANTAALEGEVKRHDLVISFLPYGMHPKVAELCLAHSKNLVTASYVSPAMRAMDEAAKAKGLIFLNELGLDPGIDHMSAMSIIDDVRSEGGDVVEFESLCGGLPAPEAADNPLGYKFSWSPRGVLTASQNSAKFLVNGQVTEIPASELLNSAKPVYINVAFNLEQIPNRDSMSYQATYQLPQVSTMYRGTLRYGLFCSTLDCLARAGLLNQQHHKIMEMSWPKLLARLMGESEKSSMGDLERAFRRRAEAPSPRGFKHGGGAIEHAMHTARWLGLFDSDSKARAADTALDSFCALLQEKLAYRPGERDMVLLHHTFGLRSALGKKVRRTSTLLAYGDDKWTAMSRTVGVPAAIGAQLILRDQIKSRGVLIPTLREIYDPSLRVLEEEGIIFSENDTELA